jgi:hypothetical protein
VDKRSAIHQRRRGIRWTALALVYPTAGTTIKAPFFAEGIGYRVEVQAIALHPNRLEARLTLAVMFVPEHLFPDDWRPTPGDNVSGSAWVQGYLIAGPRGAHKLQ